MIQGPADRLFAEAAGGEARAYGTPQLAPGGGTRTRTPLARDAPQGRARLSWHWWRRRVASSGPADVTDTR